MPAIALIVVPVCAFAIDGQVLINQSTVMAAGGFPYAITQPGSYKLSGNLTVAAPNTDAIDINVENVTLDLNGFIISGPGNSPVIGAGIFSSKLNITLKNGTITGFATGVNFAGGALVSDMSATRNTTGFVIGFGASVGSRTGSVVTRCSASLNSGTAFEIELTALSDSTATFNRDGILAASSSVIHNIVSGNSISRLTVVNSVYGSNMIITNGSNGYTDVFNAGGSRSQNNNLCSNGGGCLKRPLPHNRPGSGTQPAALATPQVPSRSLIYGKASLPKGAAQ